MTNILYDFDGIIGRLRIYISEKESRTVTAAVGIYTVLFGLFFSALLLPVFELTGTLIGGDGADQFYPYFIEFRRDLAAFFQSIADGSPKFAMINMDHAFGADVYATIYLDFIPMLPYYIFSVIVPEEGLPFFYGFGTILMAYISGLTFMYMCVYFKRNIIISGFFSAFYVFCGNAVNTGFMNQRLYYMYIAFPLLIAGIDKIITKKGFALFPLAVCYLSLLGFTFLVYTIPFVVVFALLRVYYVYPGHYFKNLGGCFVRGASAFFLGIAMGAVMFLPIFFDYMHSARTYEEITVSLSKMLTPDIDYIRNMLVPSTSPNEMMTGICAAVIPLVIYLSVSIKNEAQYKCYLITMTVLTAMPLIQYGINGFRYDICRWGFIPGALMCYLCVCMTERIARGTDKKQAGLFTAAVIVYVMLFMIDLCNAAAVFLFTCMLISAVPVLRKAAVKTWKMLTGLYKKITASPSAARVIRLGGAVVVGLFAIIYISVLMRFRSGIIPFLAAAAVFSAVVWICAKTKKVTNIVGIFTAAAIAVCGTVYLSDINFYKPSVIPELSKEEIDVLKEYSGSENGDGTFGRITFIGYDETALSDYTDPDAEGSPKEENNTVVLGNNDPVYTDIDQFNASLQYGVSDIGFFKSVFSGDYMKLLKRCGMERGSMLSVVNTHGFSGKEALYSLFGVRSMYYYDDVTRLYGLTQINKSDKEYYIHVYKNNYAYPIGVTYDNISDKARFDALRIDELPYAMMNEVYLEGSPISSNVNVAESEYAHICDIDVGKQSRGSTSFGMECFDTTVDINEDTSDCFIYLNFTGVREEREPGIQSQHMWINIDKDTIVTSEIHNRNALWQWKATNDRYCLSLGYHKDSIKHLDFITPFEYKDMWLSAVPASVYTGAYKNVTRETLGNVSVSTNSITGDITLSEDKVLVVNTLGFYGWKAYVDDVNVPVYKANDLFVGIPLVKGSHSVRLEYTTPMLAEGAVISLAAIIIFAVIVVLRRKKYRNKRNDNEA